MDQATLTAYDRDATTYAQEWETQPPPADMYAAIERHFRRGPTADIGCGSGRDVAWMIAHGFPAVGYEASAGLRAEALRRHPDLQILPASLPDLAGVPASAFANVLCETVIMHLEPAAVRPAVDRLLSLLIPGGTLYLTWRVSDGTGQRDPNGRLYATVDPQAVLAALSGATPILDEQFTSVSSGRTIRRIIARKAGHPA